MTRGRAVRPSASPRLWPQALLLAGAVLVPATCALWFMAAAVRNEGLAVRQRLEQAYRAQIERAASRLDEYWSQLRQTLAFGGKEKDAPAAFRSAIAGGACETVVLFDSEGQLLYPRVALAPEVDSSDCATTNSLEARAHLERARAFSAAGKREDALRILTETIADPEYAGAVDPQGRLITLNAQMLALDWTDDPTSTTYRALARQLAERLGDYGGAPMPSSQRAFLMKRLRGMWPDCPAFPTLEAEQLALVAVDAGIRPGESGKLVPVPRAGLWQATSADRRVVALFATESLNQRLVSVVRESIPDSGLAVEIVPPRRQPSDPNPILRLAAGAAMPDWTLALSFRGDDPFAAASGQRITLYVWTGGLVTALTAVLALALAASLRRQARLTRLKADLIATVSHELKTPLSSMRLLIDTLLEGRCPGPQQEREYLEMIAKENLRLSRLIDNFLSFSRMERNKHAFTFAPVAPGDIVEGAIASVRERFSGPDHRLEAQVDPGLPTLNADRDALTTVLINLLDNAWKYSGTEKRVTVRAIARNGRVCFEVRDNGVGIPRRAQRRIFERFYQVDQRLSRASGGCGLGLAIVKFIVDAHGGTVAVRSEPGHGSRFTIEIPASGPPSAA